MRKFVLFAVLGIVVGMYSCSSDSNSNNNNAYVADANDLLPWVNKDFFKEVKMDNHHFAFFVDTTHEFSYGFKALYNDIKVKNAKKMIVSCEGYLYQIPSKVQLVIDIKNNGQNMFWQSQAFDQQLKETSTWGNVSFSIDLPKEINPSSEILVYVWSPSHEVALFDHLMVKFE